jgi:hypothetical protein
VTSNRLASITKLASMLTTDTRNGASRSDRPEWISSARSNFPAARSREASAAAAR